MTPGKARHVLIACAAARLRVWNPDHRMARYRVTVDTGGTFSDFVYLNEADRRDHRSRRFPRRPMIRRARSSPGSKPSWPRVSGADRHRLFLPRHHGRDQRAARRQGRPDRPAGDGRISRHLSRGRAGAPLRRRDLRRHVRQAGAAGACAPHRRGQGARSISAATCCARSTRRRCAIPCANSRRRTSNRSRYACCSRSCIRSTRRACARSCSRKCPDCSVSLSSEVLPQIREYYRLSTTVINAYLQPILARYIAQLDQRLAGAGIATRQKYIMQSNGGMATFAAAAAPRRHHGACRGRPAASPRACSPARISGFGQHHHLRHGRNLLRRRADQGRRAAGLEPRQDRQGAISPCRCSDINTVSAGGGTIARRRPLRRAPGRAAQRGRSAGTGLLRPRRRRRRPSPIATWCSAISARTISSAGACGSMPAKARAAIEAKVARAARPRRGAGGRRHHAHHRREDGGGDQGASPPCAAMTCATSCCSPSAAPGRCMPARIARDLGMAGRDRAALSRRVLRDRPADVRRQARLHPVEDDAAERDLARGT